MPTYEYRCEKCGETFELIQSFSARPLRRHRECGGQVEKVFHPRGVTFKGSGFYVNDSRPQESKAEKSSNGDASKSEKAPSKSETPSKSEAPSKTTETAPASASGSAASGD